MTSGDYMARVQRWFHAKDRAPVYGADDLREMVNELIIDNEERLITPRHVRGVLLEIVAAIKELQEQRNAA